MRHDDAPPASRGRRSALRVLGAGALLVVLRPARATPAELQAALHELFAERKITPGRIKLEVPRLAENGNIVPVTVTVDSPMTEQDYVARIHLFAEDNPQPRIADIELSPYNGKPRVSTRVRVAISQHLHAVAEMSDGSLWSTAVEIEVTVGGCAP
jgi:sulfur-oxidizing protein SoxY